MGVRDRATARGRRRPPSRCTKRTALVDMHVAMSITDVPIYRRYAPSVLPTHQEWELGVVEAGSWVHVTLWGAACDVLLLTPPDLARFREGRPFSFVGGHFQGSRVRLVIPTSGPWHVVVVPGPAGPVEATVHLTHAA